MRFHIFDRSPGASEDLVGSPTEQEGVGALVDLADQGLGLASKERHGPSTTREPASGILLRPAKPLHHAVDREVGVGRQFHELVLSLVVVVCFMSASLH
jgi:hypothetical protein